MDFSIRKFGNFQLSGNALTSNELLHDYICRRMNLLQFDLQVFSILDPGMTNFGSSNALRKGVFDQTEFTAFHFISPCLKHGGYQMRLTILAAVLNSEFNCVTINPAMTKKERLINSC